MTTCRHCGEPMPKSRAGQKYCSGRCCKAAWAEKNRALTNERYRAKREASLPEPNPCQLCGEPIRRGHRPDQRFCSRRCRSRAYHRRGAPNSCMRACEQCSAPLPLDCRADRRYCSTICIDRVRAIRDRDKRRAQVRARYRLRRDEILARGKAAQLRYRASHAAQIAQSNREYATRNKDYIAARARRIHARNLNLIETPRRGSWTAAEDAVAARDDLAIREIAVMLQRTPGSIVSRRTRLRRQPTNERG